VNIFSSRGVFGYSSNSFRGSFQSKSLGERNRQFNVLDKYTPRTKQSINYKDTKELLTQTKNVLPQKVTGVNVDKKTAVNTTIYVDKNTYNEILSYTTNNREYSSEEMGCDGDKRWIVVNGQRFQSELSKEEKEAFKKRFKYSSLDSFLGKESSSKDNAIKNNPIKVSLDANKKIKIDGDDQVQSNSKLKNLMKNGKVMEMLSDIIEINKGNGIVLNLG
jgi:ribosomal protein S18